jgi:sugar-specific transcriptional regulator TrmB
VANITQIANKVANSRQDQILKFAKDRIKAETKEIVSDCIEKLQRLSNNFAEDWDQAPKSILKVTAQDIENIAGKDLTPDEIEEAVEATEDAIISAISETLDEVGKDLVDSIKKAVTQIPLNEATKLNMTITKDESTALLTAANNLYRDTKKIVSKWQTPNIDAVTAFSVACHPKSGLDPAEYMEDAFQENSVNFHVTKQEYYFDELEKDFLNLWDINSSGVVNESDLDVLSDDDPLQKSSYVNTKPVAFRVVLETPRDIDDEEMTAQVMLFSERHPDAELSDFGPTTSGKFYIDVIFYTEQASRKAELENDPEMDVIAVEQYPDSVFSGEVDPNDVGL